jgi:hypothetical protein
MAVGCADIWKALNAAWDASDLGAKFKALWADPADAKQIVLHDQEASSGQNYPYCVVDVLSPKTTTRMSGGSDRLREIREAQVTLNVHVEEVTGDSRSAKQIAAYLAEELMKVFGGHPTVVATASLTLDNGAALLIEYQTDYGVRIDDDEFNWVISYKIVVDVPVMA